MSMMGGLLSDVLEEARTQCSTGTFAKQFMVPISRYPWLFPPQGVLKAGGFEAVARAQVEDKGNFGSTHHLLEGVKLAILLSLLRIILDAFIFKPIGRFMMKLNTSARTPINPKFERFRKQSSYVITGKEAHSIGDKLGVSWKEVRVYFRERRLDTRDDKKLFKFKEAMWRNVLYISSCIIGFVALRDQPWWTRHIEECWVDYPLQEISTPIFWFYMFELGMYLHLFVFQFFDTKRSDFWEMFIHHLATISLIVSSWLVQFIRAGSLVMIVHDVADVLLETAKIFNYTKDYRPWAQLWCDAFFVMFALVFGVTRLGVFPFWIIRSSFTDAFRIIGPEGYEQQMKVFYAMLLVLELLHIFWFGLILRMAYRMLIVGMLEKDIRSDDESEDDDDHHDHDHHDDDHDHNNHNNHQKHE